MDLIGILILTVFVFICLCVLVPEIFYAALTIILWPSILFGDFLFWVFFGKKNYR